MRSLRVTVLAVLLLVQWSAIATSISREAPPSDGGSSQGASISRSIPLNEHPNDTVLTARPHHSNPSTASPRHTKTEDMIFADGFETGDTSRWSLAGETDCSASLTMPTAVKE